MKNLLMILFSTLINTPLFAQAPQKMSYQAVIRNSSNVLVTNTAIGMRVTILQGSASGTVVYQEIFNPNPQTNINGLVTVEIGAGIPITGTFAAINWATGPYFIMTEIDPSGGTVYSIIGVQQLLSVPYALYAATSGNSSIAPTLSTQMATNVLPNSATLNGIVNANGFRSDVTFDFGLTTAYGSTTSTATITGNSNTPLTFNYNGLTANTVYHYRIKAINAVDITYGSDMSFTTPFGAPIVAWNNIADTVDATTIQLSAYVNPNGNNTIVTFEYGTSTSYGTTVAATPSPITGSGNQQVLSGNITGLVAGTTYHYRAKAVSSFGTAYGPDQTYYCN